MIVAFDSLALLAISCALLFLFRGRKRAVVAELSPLLGILLTSSLLYMAMTWSEWAGITNRFEGLEDFTGAILPMFWAFLFYAWIQHGLQADLRRGEENLRVTLDSIGDAVVATDTAGRITRMNPEAERLTGWAADEAEGHLLTEVFGIYSALDGSRIADPVSRVLESRAIVGLANHTLLESRAGTRTHISYSAAPIRNGGPRISGVVMVFRDVSEDYRLRSQLVENEERLELVLEGAGLASWDWDVPSGEVTCDARWAAMVREDPKDLVQSIEAFERRIHPEDRAHRLEALQAHFDARTPAYESEHRLAMGDGDWCWILDRGRVTLRDDLGNPVRVSGTHLDRSARKGLEERMQNRAKLEAIGRLAGGVAHDLNNLLTPILGYSDLLAASDDMAKEDRVAVNQILQAGWSARDLVGQLLAFGRRQHLRVLPLNLNKVIENFEQLLRRTIPEHIEVKSILDPDLAAILADAGQIEQILMNLAVNAADAMPDGGTLEIRTALGKPAGVDDTAREYVCLSIRDTGCGMVPEVRDQVFEPFFSTKGDQGSGLGLATVYGIVRQHHGLAHVESEPGQGTTFEILLPVAEQAAEQRSGVEAEELPRGRGEMILLVDDDHMVLRIARALLKNQGYEVTAALDGVEALELLKLPDCEIELLLTDMVMPGLSGRDLYKQARKVRPDLRVVFMSGYDERASVEEQESEAGQRFLMKPFSTRDLATEVREALDASHAYEAQD